MRTNADPNIGNWCHECNEPKPISDTFCAHCGSRLAWVLHTKDFKEDCEWLVRVDNRDDLSFYLILERTDGKCNHEHIFSVRYGRLVKEKEEEAG